MFNRKNAVPPVQTGKSMETKAATPLFEKTQSRPTPPQALEPGKPALVKPDGLITARDQTPTQTKDVSVNQKTPTPPAFRPDLSRLDSPRTETSRPDLSRFDSPRRTEMPQSNSSKPEAATEMRKLIVGRDIALAGEISACDYLVVEGTVEARVREGRHIEIADTGPVPRHGRNRRSRHRGPLRRRHHGSRPLACTLHRPHRRQGPVRRTGSGSRRSSGR